MKTIRKSIWLKLIYLVAIVFLIVNIIWILIPEENGSIVSEVVHWILSLVALIFIVVILHAWKTSSKFYITFFDEKFEYFNGENIKICIPYKNVKKIQYVMRKISDPDYSKEGIKFNEIKELNKYAPFYDVIDCNDNLLCTIELVMINIRKLNEVFLAKGILIEDREGQLLQNKRRLKGHDILELQENPIHILDTEETKQFIEIYNSEKEYINKRRLEIIGNIFIAGSIMLLFGIGLRALSFLTVGITVLVLGIVIGYHFKSSCLLEVEDDYEGGMVYLGRDLTNFIVYSKDGEIKRENISSFLCANQPQIGNLNTYIKKLNTEEIFICRTTKEKNINDSKIN